jgi:hypothetical protein
MSLVIIEAAVVGIKEAAKLGIVWLVYSSFLREHNREGFLKAFYMGVALASGLALVSFFVPSTLAVKDFLARLIGYVFFLFFLGSVAALYRPAVGVNRKWDAVLGPLAVVLTIVYFSPDIIGSTMFVREIAEMKAAYLPTYVSAATGFALALALTVLALGRFKHNIGRFFGLGQFLLFLSVIKLLGGGIRGFAELSLIPSVQRGVMKFFHDVTHLVLIFFMVPDHPMLSITTWNFIGILFGSNIAIAAVLALLLAPPAMFLYHGLLAPLPEPSEAGTGAERRLLKAAARADRRRKALPVVLFICVILVFWFSGRAEDITRLYNPQPKPVVEDKGIIVIPLTDPTMDIRDGSLHKFSFYHEGESIVIMVIEKPDGKLAVCLDACEICPPEGYGLSGEEVVCIYCRTPIPTDTLGVPGGCNPIPLDVQVTDSEIRIAVKGLLEKWNDVITGKTKEAIR